jgi:hypothetical protein
LSDGSNWAALGINRFIPGTGGGGFPVTAHVTNGVVSKTARIRIEISWAAWNTYGSLFETDGLLSFSVNGFSTDIDGNMMKSGTKTRVAQRGCADEGYSDIYEFEVDVTHIKLAPIRGDFNNLRNPFPAPAENKITVTMNPSVVSPYTVKDLGMYSMGIQISFDCMSPYILVHGKGADKNYWEAGPPDGHAGCWPPYADLLRQKLLPFDENITLTGLIPTLPSQDSVINQARDLNNQIPWIIASFGSYYHANLIAHSKGGLDCRYWLTEINPSSYNYVIGQFITLSTPHSGSVLADCVCVGKFVNVVDIEANVAVGMISLDASGFLQIFQAILTFDSTQDTPATYCLRTNARTNVDTVGNKNNDTQTYNWFYGQKLIFKFV